MTNLSYWRLDKDDHLKISFATDCSSFIVQNSNPFSLERKFSSNNDQQFLYMLWEKCIKNEFYKSFCQNNNFIFLNQSKGTYHKPNEIVREFVLAKGCDDFIRYFQQYHLVYQFIKSMIFPKFIVLNKKYSVEIRSKFMIHYKNWIDCKRKRSGTNNTATRLATAIAKLCRKKFIKL